MIFRAQCTCTIYKITYTYISLLLLHRNHLLKQHYLFSLNFYTFLIQLEIYDDYCVSSRVQYLMYVISLPVMTYLIGKWRRALFFLRLVLIWVFKYLYTSIESSFIYSLDAIKISNINLLFIFPYAPVMVAIFFSHRH